MRRLQYHVLQCVRVLVLVSLTLVPLALSGHFHSATERGTPDACVACVAQHQTHGACVSVAPVSAPVLNRSSVVASVTSAPAFVSLPFRTGRAPPAPFTLA